MCGICGLWNKDKSRPADENLVKKMIMVQRHRGPDGAGVFLDGSIGLGHARLSVIDLEGGGQPLCNEDRSIWITFNGEIFNYIEVKSFLEKKGHVFRTHSDTEVIIHLYEEMGEKCLSELNGQFAFAIWDSRKRRLLLARDRVGILPLFYTVLNGTLFFSSEIKAFLAEPSLRLEIDPMGLTQFFSYWANLSPTTLFKGIHEVPPGHFLFIQDDFSMECRRYWTWEFSPIGSYDESVSLESWQERLDALLQDAIRIRLRADVSVGAYLSGGLDSSLLCAMVRKYFKNRLETFSIGFADKDYDESDFQKQMALALGTNHKKVSCGSGDIASMMPQVIWHAEKLLIRTAPAPLFCLSGLVRENGYKVVLTGEGADEILAGYDLFREMKIRRFWAKQPQSSLRPLLFTRLYQYLPNWPRRASRFLESFYRGHLPDTGHACYSHFPRWHTNRQVLSFLSPELKVHDPAIKQYADLSSQLPSTFTEWDTLSQAQYIETMTLLSGNLLSSQGDRMIMGHSVEGRFPFLDHRVMALCAAIPPKYRLNGMNEKYVLKKVAGPLLPSAIANRVKQGYRSPDSASFFDGTPPDYLQDVLSSKRIQETGYFQVKPVEQLVQKCRTTPHNLIGARYNMAIVGIITTMLLDDMFVRNASEHITRSVQKFGDPSLIKNVRSES